MGSDTLLASLRAAVEAAPEDVALRAHLAELLAAAGERAEAVREAGAVLQRDPSNETALRVVAGGPALDRPPPAVTIDDTDGVDDVLRGLESQLADIAPPMFVSSEPPTAAFETESAGVCLDDVGGMDEVKSRLEAAFLAPLKNPDLLQLYGKSLRGGLLLYGPPGCGKTFIARAVAGEMGAQFLPIGLSDVLDMFVGQSERNLHEIFETARRSAPCVVFLDEVDALGQKRSHLRHSAARGTVNQLLSEMDGLSADNDGVFVLGATNHPWDVDVALRRPGRFDRMVLVLPPDDVARQAIFKYHLRNRPIANIDLGELARRTDGYSGADLAHVCETGAERALLDSARSGTPRMIEMADLLGALEEVRPSIGPWLDTARNVAQFANEDGTYDELLGYLRKRRKS